MINREPWASFLELFIAVMVAVVYSAFIFLLFAVAIFVVALTGG